MYFSDGLSEFSKETVFSQVYLPEQITSRAEYLIDRKVRGKFLYANFPVVRNIGIGHNSEVKPMRPELGDFEHVASAALRFFSSLYLSPVFAHEFYRLGKIIGYCSIPGLVKTLNINPAALKGSRNRSLQNRIILEAQKKSWRHMGRGNIENIEINMEKQWMKYTLKENSCSIINTLSSRHQHDPLTKPCNCIDVGILCGQTEALLGGVWDGFETECMGKGDHACGIELHLQDGRTTPRICTLTKEEYFRILDKNIDLAISKERNSSRGCVGDYQTISLSQSVNYLLLSTSKGHVILSKWAGKKVGEQIMKKKGICNLFDALDYLKKLFRDLRMGLIECEPCLDSIRIRVDESVYSSGVNNINMKLCIFLAGIIEGCINEATKMKGSLDDESEWLVTETQCTANGDPYCEFICRHRDPEKLMKLVLG